MVCSTQKAVVKSSTGWFVQGRLVERNLHLSQSTFIIICNELHPFIQRNNANLRFAISVKERVAITFWKLSTSIEYRTLSELFGIGRSTNCEIVYDTCQQILMNLQPTYANAKTPKGDGLKELVQGFELTISIFIFNYPTRINPSWLLY